VAYLLEAFGGFAAHALGRRAGGEQLRVRGLDALELVHQRVVGGVGNLRGIEDVIEVFVAAEFGAQFFGALSRA
jgi:hypothetical protein